MGAEGLESEAATLEITRIDASCRENAAQAGTNGGGSAGPRSDALLSFLRFASQGLTVTEQGVERTHLVSAAQAAACSAVGGLRPTTTNAVRLAIKLAVDAGEYDRAAALLEVVRQT